MHAGHQWTSTTIPRIDQALTPGKAALPLSISGPRPRGNRHDCSCDGVIQGSSKGTAPTAPTELTQQPSYCRFCREPPTVPSPWSIKRDEGQPRTEISHHTTRPPRQLAGSMCACRCIPPLGPGTGCISICGETSISLPLLVPHRLTGGSTTLTILLRVAVVFFCGPFSAGPLDCP